MELFYSFINFWTEFCIVGFYLKHHVCLLGFFNRTWYSHAIFFSATWVRFRINEQFFEVGEEPSHFFPIFLAGSFFLYWRTKARGTNVRQFLTRSNFQIMNISCCLGVISFYFPPLEVVHPVDDSIPIIIDVVVKKEHGIEQAQEGQGTITKWRELILRGTHQSLNCD